MSRFDYIKYDIDSIASQELFKRLCIQLENGIEAVLVPSRPKSLAITALEECYMWVGKAIRDEQIARDGSAELQEERSKS